VVAAGRSSRPVRAANAKEQSPFAAESGSKATDSATGKSLHSTDNLQAYVNDYLRAMRRNRPKDELHFYADRVNYLGNGWVDRRIIENTLRKYRARWPRRSYSAVGNIDFRAIPGRGEIVVKFRMDFKLSRGFTHAQGQTENEIVINAATADPRIISITERRVRP
jgi:hypothetical protein